MPRRIFRRMRVGLLVALAAVVGIVAVSQSQVAPANRSTSLVCADGSAGTNGPVFNLRATTGRISTPEGNSIYMWGFADVDGPSPWTNRYQNPGPVLCATQGETVTVHLRNDLPARFTGENVSIAFPGQENVQTAGGVAGVMTAEAVQDDPVGVTYSFVAGEPGTYLYESATTPEKQVQMGLYGALVIRPTMGANFAYNDAATRFDASREYMMLLHEVDPDLHYAVERGRPYDVSKFHPKYWTINGRSFPDTIAGNRVSWLPYQPYSALMQTVASDPLAPADPALIRYANAGMDNHPFHPHGNHLRVVARDGRLLRGPNGEDTSMEAFTKTIGSGQTYDLTFAWYDLERWSSTGNPLPITMPGDQNLVWKDGATFYSGSPYLGERDELPKKVATFNECGEFYFPWHSHALTEFQNYDAGFGGMATLARVDPPANMNAGC